MFNNKNKKFNKISVLYGFSGQLCGFFNLLIHPAILCLKGFLVVCLSRSHKELDFGCGC